MAITLGYGRDDAGRVGQNAGFNAYKLRTWDGLHRGEGLKLRKTGKQYRLATTQDHHAIDKVGAAEIQKRVPGLVRGVGSTSTESSSSAVWPAYSGLMSGCTASNEPSQPWARPQPSR